jgi:hypothetical protein
MYDISVLKTYIQHADIVHSITPVQKACRGYSFILTSEGTVFYLLGKDKSS